MDIHPVATAPGSDTRQRIISPEHLSNRAQCIHRNSSALRMLASDGLNSELRQTGL